MRLVLDASAVVAWFVQRADAVEATLADQILTEVQREEAIVPSLWFPEVTNALLVAERLHGTPTSATNYFLAELGALPIVEDDRHASASQGAVLKLARRHALTAYDSTYLELALRTGRTLATFDRKLAAAARNAGIPVFGDPS